MAQRFYGEFRDDQGDDWRINIYDEEYTGATSEITLGSTGFVISYEGNQSDPFQRIIPSKVTFDAHIRSSTAFETWVNDTIVQRNEAQVQIAIYKDPDGDNDFWWGGVVLVDQVQIPDDYDAMVEFTASDGLALLQRDRYETSLASINTLLATMIARNPISDFWSTGNGFLRYVNDYYALGYTGTDYLDDATVKPPKNHSELDFNGNPTEFTTYEKIEALLSAFNMRLFQAEGHWYALPISYYEQIKDGGNPSTLFRQVDKAGTSVSLLFVESTYLNNNKILEDGVDFTRMAGGQIMHLNGKKVVRIRRQAADQQFLYRSIQAASNNFENISGHVGSTNGLTYPQDTGFRIETSNTWFREPDADIVGDAALVELQLVVTLQAGSYYYNGTTWTTTASTWTIPIFEFLRDSGTIDLVEVWSAETTPLPVDGDGLVFSGTFQFINGLDVNVDDDMENGLLGWNVQLKLAGESSIPDYVYSAETTEENFDEVDLAPTLFGSFSPQPAFSNLNGTIYEGGAQATFYQSYLWDGSSLAGEPLLSLVTDEALRMVQFPMKLSNNSYLHEVPQMWQVIQQGSTYWAPLRISTVMNTRQSSIERYLIDFDGANITTDDGPIGGPTDIGAAGFTGGGGEVDTVNGVSPVSGDVTIDSDDIDYTGTGGGSITSAIGANTSNIDNLKTYVVADTDKVELKEDANNKIEVDGTSAAEKVTITVAGTDALEIDDATASFSGLVKSDGIELNNLSDSLIMKDSAGDRWRIQIQTDGTLRTTKL